MKIYILTTYGCEYCEELINKLNNLNIQYIDIKIDDHPAIWVNVMLETKSDAIPVLIINKNESESIIYIPVRDFNTIDELIEIILENTK
jgi:glutaredoxin